jgi:hypothetical protein
LGSTGDDTELLDRIVQIDPRGNDTWANNAGGSTLLDPVFGDFNIVTPIAVSIDLSGNDRYETYRISSSIGASSLGLGFGLALDLSGDDSYFCVDECLGSGLGLIRDYLGNDEYHVGESAIGDGFPLGVIRDDHGEDLYVLNRLTGGYSSFPAMVGLLWDRSGTDIYATYYRSDSRLGWGREGGRGWFVDEGI